jgi:hypothetical protein
MASRVVRARLDDASEQGLSALMADMDAVAADWPA